VADIGEAEPPRDRRGDGANVTLAQFKKRLLRDFKAHPMKAAVLGLLVLVAAYFWAPLFAKMLPGEKTPEAVAPGYLDDSVAEDSAGTTPEAPSAPRRDWRKLLAQIESDPLTKPAVGLASATWSLGRDEPLAEAAEADPAAAELAAAEAAMKITPASVGLKLSGTMVGSGRKVAVISGKSYQEGRELRLTDELVFVVAEVTARKVVLRRGDESFVLELPERAGVQ